MFHNALVKILELSYRVRLLADGQHTRLLLRSFVFVCMTLLRDVTVNLEKLRASVIKFTVFYEARIVIDCFKSSTLAH